jgi:hypothetical protein
MLSVDKCKKVLGSNYCDDDISKIRETLYQMANILVKQYIETKEKK